MICASTEVQHGHSGPGDKAIKLLGIDVGTGGTRALLIDESGAVVASAIHEHQPFAIPAKRVGGAGSARLVEGLSGRRTQAAARDSSDRCLGDCLHRP